MALNSSSILLDKGFCLSVDKHRAEVAELVDALGSGSSGGYSVPVQIRASAPKKINVSFLLMFHHTSSIFSDQKEFFQALMNSYDG
jgi:hypothetical protein